MFRYLITLSVAAVLAAGCTPAPQSGRGFTLPEGDVARGQATFVELQCNACHKVKGVDLPAAENATDLSVALGGKVARIQTYGELVTSIINPSHKIAKGYAKEEVTTDAEGQQSRMLNYNEIATVEQLADLVAFLQSHYELQPVDMTEYPPYL
jgi:sulfur-oxidizing protein SoxX